MPNIVIDKKEFSRKTFESYGYLAHAIRGSIAWSLYAKSKIDLLLLQEITPPFTLYAILKEAKSKPWAKYLSNKALSITINGSFNEDKVKNFKRDFKDEPMHCYNIEKTKTLCAAMIKNFDAWVFSLPKEVQLLIGMYISEYKSSVEINNSNQGLIYSDQLKMQKELSQINLRKFVFMFNIKNGTNVTIK